MDNTENNKQLFFSIYFKQRVRKICSIDGTVQKELYLNYELSNVGDDYLELTPLNLISDEDAIEVANLQDILYEDTADVIEHMRINIINDWFQFRTADFLRSKSYALPFMGLSVEQMIDFGWIKLKTN